MSGITTEVSQFINNVGFPVFIAIWVLVKQSKDTDKMASAMQDVKEALIMLKSHCLNRDNN